MRQILNLHLAFQFKYKSSERISPQFLPKFANAFLSSNDFG